LVEFVLIAPLLLLLFFGIVEFARAWNIRHVVTDAAREAARNLAVNDAVSEDSATTIIGSALGSAGLNPSNAVIVFDTNPEQSRVTITYGYELGIVRVLLGWAVADGQLNIGTSFVMRNEGQGT
jgi:Flp pilus assembly protein TadG